MLIILSAARSVPGALFHSANFTAQYFRSVGQDVPPGMCVLLSTSKSVRKAMKLWDVSGGGGFGKFSWMSGILVVILISLGGLGLELFPEVLVRLFMGSAAVGALPLGFQIRLGVVRGKYLPADLHAAEASNVSSSSISAFRDAIVRAVWSSKMPLANVLAVLNLLEGSVDVDPFFHIIWSSFRVMRRILAYCPEEEPRIFRMLGLISRRAFLGMLMTCPSLCNDIVFIDRVVDTAGLQQRQVRTVPNCALGLAIDMPVIVHVMVVDMTVVAQRPFPLVQFSRPLRFPSCTWTW